MMTITQYTAAAENLTTQLDANSDILLALEEGRGTPAQVEDWNECHDIEWALCAALEDLKIDWAVQNSSGIHEWDFCDLLPIIV